MEQNNNSKQISQAVFLKRLMEISQIEEDIKIGNKVNATNLSKVAYVLWKNLNARNSDITLALDYYKTFHKDLVPEENIPFDVLYQIPKMYDIQRDRAKIQNEYHLFPASTDIQEKRQQKREDFKKCWISEKQKSEILTAEHSLYFDESGKEENNFILAGISIDELIITSDKYRKYIEKIKNELQEKYRITCNELKFADIKSGTVQFYKDLIERIFENDYIPTFYSISIEQRGLKQHSKKEKTTKLTEFILIEALRSILQKSTMNSTLNSFVKVNITLDEDGQSPDICESKQKKYDIQTQLNKDYKHFVQVENLKWIKSDDDILVQLADLYASSLNNVFSMKPEDSNTAKAKKEFALFFMEKVGIKNIDDRGNFSTIFLHRNIK